MVLSDRTIREQLASGRLVIDPGDESLLQPSSVDVRVDADFRVFHNNRRAYIDVKEANDDLTPEQLEKVLAVDPAEWRAEVPQIQAWFDTIGSDKVPTMLWTELDGLKARLGE